MHKNFDNIRKVTDIISSLDSQIYKYVSEDPSFIFSIYDHEAALINAFKVSDGEYVADFGTSRTDKYHIYDEVMESGIDRNIVINTDRYFSYPINVTYYRPAENVKEHVIIHIRIFDLSVYVAEDSDADGIVLEYNPIRAIAISKAVDKYTNIGALNAIVKNIFKSAETGARNTTVNNTQCNLWAANKLEEAGYTISVQPEVIDISW
jgi:hypothetical protein